MSDASASVRPKDLRGFVMGSSVSLGDRVSRVNPIGSISGEFNFPSGTSTTTPMHSAVVSVAWWGRGRPGLGVVSGVDVSPKRGVDFQIHTEPVHWSPKPSPREDLDLAAADRRNNADLGRCGGGDVLRFV